jgi:ribosomal-protein-alanine N-acetyltransferase
MIDQTPRIGAPYISDDIAIKRMTLADIPGVMAIERESFPTPWPASAYRHELTGNPKAYFIVAHSSQLLQPLQLNSAPSVEKPKPTWLSRLFNRSSLFFAQPITNNQSTNNQQPNCVVGYAGMWNMVDEMHIATIAAHPRLRGRGIGELLLIDLLRESQRQNALNATLEVRVSNTVAQCLYKKYGFEEVGRRKAYYQNNREDALIMTVTHFQTEAFAAKLNELEASFYGQRP